MRVYAVVSVLAGASSVSEAFLTAPLAGRSSSAAVTLQGQQTCVSNARGSSSRTQARTVQQMVAATSKTDAVSAVPHGGTLVDLNLKTDAEKQVSGWAGTTKVHMLYIRFQAHEEFYVLPLVCHTAGDCVYVHKTVHTTPIEVHIQHISMPNLCAVFEVYVEDSPCVCSIM